MMGQRTSSGDPLGQGREVAGVFQWIARGHQPPDTVEFESLECEQSCREVCLMWRIEGSTKQADPHAGRVRRQ